MVVRNEETNESYECDFSRRLGVGGFGAVFKGHKVKVLSNRLQGLCTGIRENMNESCAARAFCPMAQSLKWFSFLVPLGGGVTLHLWRATFFFTYSNLIEI